MHPTRLSETDICDQCITPALQRAGWSLHQHILREYTLRPGRVVVRGQAAHRDKVSMLWVGYVLFHKPNPLLGDTKYLIGACMPRAIQCVDLCQRLAEALVFNNPQTSYPYKDASHVA